MMWRKVKTKTGRKPPGVEEERMQMALFRWVEVAMRLQPGLELMFAVPNGGKRDARTAGRLKAAGVRAGVPDILLPVHRAGYSGLVLELKVGKNKPSEAQSGWLRGLSKEGWLCVVVWDDWDWARQVVEAYLREETAGLWRETARDGWVPVKDGAGLRRALEQGRNGIEREVALARGRLRARSDGQEDGR